MIKLLLALSMVTGSVVSFAQSDMSSPIESRVEGTFPELKPTEEGQRKYSAGVVSGVNSPKGPDASSTEFGVIVQYQPYTSMTAGVSANTTRLNTDNDVRQTNVLFRSAYNFGGDIPIIKSSFIGVGVGPLFVSNRVRWAGAPIIGFDIPLAKKTKDYLSLGLEAKYLFITNTDVPNLFASALALKYWF